MTTSRHIPLSIHAGLETLAAPLVMVAPFLLGFGQAATVASIIVGVLLLGLALQIPGPQRSVSLSSHASFDYLLAAFAAISGLTIGVGTGSWEPAIFLVGIGAAQVALTASTRFSSTRSIY
jgi:hypothetical protein